MRENIVLRPLQQRTRGILKYLDTVVGNESITPENLTKVVAALNVAFVVIKVELSSYMVREAGIELYSDHDITEIIQRLDTLEETITTKAPNETEALTTLHRILDTARRLLNKRYVLKTPAESIFDEITVPADGLFRFASEAEESQGGQSNTVDKIIKFKPDIES